MTCTRNFLVRTKNLWFYTVCHTKRLVQRYEGTEIPVPRAAGLNRCALAKNFMHACTCTCTFPRAHEILPTPSRVPSYRSKANCRIKADAQRHARTRFRKDATMTKSILLTGGAGFIASHVARLLAEKYPAYQVTSVRSRSRRDGSTCRLNCN